MKNLAIKIISSMEEVIWGLRSYIGEIIINDFKETFEVPIEFWTLDDYKRQWHEGLERIKNEKKSCLITRVEGYKGKPVHLEFWTMHKMDHRIIIENCFYRGTSLVKLLKNRSFTPETCYQFIPRMSQKKEVSRWVIDLE